MPDSNTQTHVYQVGNTTFIVTPVYPVAKGETMFSILFKLMKADMERH